MRRTQSGFLQSAVKIAAEITAFFILNGILIYVTFRLNIHTLLLFYFPFQTIEIDQFTYTILNIRNCLKIIVINISLYNYRRSGRLSDFLSDGNKTIVCIQYCFSTFSYVYIAQNMTESVNSRNRAKLP